MQPACSPALPTPRKAILWSGPPRKRWRRSFPGWQFRFEPGQQQPEPDKGLFPWLSYTREGNARLINSAKPRQAVKLTAVAKRRCLSDRDPQTERADPQAQAEIRKVLTASDLSKHIEADLREATLTYSYLRNACVQEFEASLGGKRKKGIRTIFWRFERRDENDPDASLDVWSVFARDGDAFKPRYLTRVLNELEGPTELFEVLAGGDLNGDGTDEWVVRSLEFEAEEDHLLIFSWENDAPAIVHDSDRRRSSPQARQP